MLCVTFSASAQEHQKDKKEIEKLISIYQKAVNEKDYELFKSTMAKDFQIGGAPPIHSAIDAYSSILYKSDLQNKIVEIKNLNIEIINDSTALAKFDKIHSWAKYKVIATEVTFSKTNGEWKTRRFIKGFRTPTKEEVSIVYSLRIDSLNDGSNFNIINPNNHLVISKDGYNVYYEKEYEKEAEYCLSLLLMVDSIVREKLGMRTLIREHMLLTSEKGTLIIIGDESVWTIKLDENQLLSNKGKILQKATVIFSHEVTEETLVQKYGMPTVENRWYRDGMAEYIGSKVTKAMYPEIYDKYYTNLRYQNEYLKHKASDNLLDWRGSGPKSKEYGNLIGENFTYFNDNGQYGRALQFFLDLSELYGDDIIIRFHKELEGKKKLSNRKLIQVMSKITGEDLFEKIKKY
ncbi:hypothetical protein JYT14_00630 [Flavobacteriales bacterium AH-315-E23]|nr:hypothetical protein [Flavobacteriales bacterium AH-315-E23]